MLYLALDYLSNLGKAEGDAHEVQVKEAAEVSFWSIVMTVKLAVPRAAGPAGVALAESRREQRLARSTTDARCTPPGRAAWRLL